MAGFDNDVVYGTNVNFSTSSAGGGAASILTDGQMLIGTTALNVGGTHISVGKITSPLGTVAVGYSAPNITLDVTGGSSAIEKFLPNSGTSPVVPDGSGQVSLVGVGSITTVGGLNSLTTELTGLTNHSVQVGAGTTTLTQLAVGTNGQVLIGANSADPAFASLTSSDGSVTFTTGANSLSLQVAGGATTGKTITGNSGGALSPTAGNWNLLGPNSALTGYSPWTTGSGSTLTFNMPGTVKWVVNAIANLGTNTTIQAAITAASSGDNVFITPGTYTENLTLKGGVNLVAYGTDSASGNVTIVGKATFSGTGTVNIYGIELQTNSDFFYVTSGANGNVTSFKNCNFNCLNNTGINATQTGGGALGFYNCSGNIATTGITLITNSGTSVVVYDDTNIGNSGASTTASTSSSSGSMSFVNSAINFPINVSGTSTLYGYSSVFSTTGAFNTTMITYGGSATNSVMYYCTVASGSASAVSISSALTMIECTINSSNTNSITGGGTLVYGGMMFLATTTINVTTQTPLPLTVQQGGTFKSSFDAFSLVCAGTTTTGAFQDVPSVATGQVLSSAGTAALPVWTATPTLTSITFGAGTALSDYEEGTWSPTVVGAVAGTTTYTSQVGTYVKIGNFVWLQARIALSAATGTGNALFTSFPFTTHNRTNQNNINSAQPSATGWTWPALTTSMNISASANVTQGLFQGIGSGVASASMQMFNASAIHSYTLNFET